MFLPELPSALDSNSSFSFVLPGSVYNATPPRIIFGVGSSEGLADEVLRLGKSKALVVCTPGRRAMGEEVAKRLGHLCAGVMAEAVSQVPIALAHRGQKLAKELGADCLISIGGGASIGLGKGISLELGLPIIAVPTTYSGSEMTGFCGITIDNVKVMHKSLNMLAHTVIYDPILTKDLPLNVSAASALNALAHCIDGVYVSSISPLLRPSAAIGASSVINGIRRVWSDPHDISARSELLYGAFLSGAVLTGGFALQHGLAHTLGGSFGVPHGDAHAVVLPYVTAYNSIFSPKEMKVVAEALNVTNLAGTIYDLLIDPGPVTHESVHGILLSAYRGNRPLQ